MNPKRCRRSKRKSRNRVLHHASYRHGNCCGDQCSTHGRDARGEACLENAEGAACAVHGRYFPTGI